MEFIAINPSIFSAFPIKMSHLVGEKFSIDGAEKAAELSEMLGGKEVQAGVEYIAYLDGVLTGLSQEQIEIWKASAASIHESTLWDIPEVVKKLTSQYGKKELMSIFSKVAENTQGLMEGQPEDIKAMVARQSNQFITRWASIA